MQKQIISTLLRVEGQNMGEVCDLSKNQPSVGPHVSMSFTYKVVNKVDILCISSRRNPANSPVSSLSASLLLCSFSGRHTRIYTHKHPCMTLWVRRGDMLLNFSKHQESQLLWALDVLALADNISVVPASSRGPQEQGLAGRIWQQRSLSKRGWIRSERVTVALCSIQSQQGS